jgi:hypothetical protein
MRFTCQNITMAQFADWLPQSGAGIGPMSYATELKGAWALTLTYGHPIDLMNQRQRSTEASSPSGGAPLRPVMVIDHIEEKPTGQ